MIESLTDEEKNLGWPPERTIYPSDVTYSKLHDRLSWSRPGPSLGPDSARRQAQTDVNPGKPGQISGDHSGMARPMVAMVGISPNKGTDAEGVV